MEHDDAIRSQAAERYLAGELSSTERDAFEDHFFGCQECAEEVRLGQVFAANVRALAREQRALPPVPGFLDACRAWLHAQPVFAFSLAVNLLLALGFGYILLTGGRPAVQPQFLPAYFAPAPTHGEEVHEIPAGASAFVAHIPEPSQKYPSYSYEILNAAGNRESFHVAPALAGEDRNLYLQVPVQDLPGGLHTLVIRGLPGGEIISWSRFHTSR
ncbi:MAG: zf-HC2 domain-containing protein [Bryobacteraceae bacterium]|jgi:hypothetical protein